MMQTPSIILRAMSADTIAGTSGSRRPRLLVVEDDQDIADIIKRYFSAQGFDVAFAADGVAMR